MSVVAPPEPPRPDELEALIREARSRQRRRQVLFAAVVATGAAAAFAVHADLAGSRSTSARSRGGGPSLPSLPRCRSDQLSLTVPKTWGAAAGSLIEQFTLTNTSRAGCVVAGWPAVRRFDAGGRPIPVEISRWVYGLRGPAPFQPVRLRPGDAASFPVISADWNHAANRACPTAETLRVEPSGGGGWLSTSLRTPLPACRRWDVGPLVPGRQAPWPSYAFSMFHTEHGRTYSGYEDGAAWKLTAKDSGDGRYCFSVFTNGNLRGSRCGRLDGAGVPGKLAWISRSGGTGPSFVAGAVVSRAQVVAVGLSHGYPQIMQTMPPTRRLASGITFFFTTVPRGVYPVSIVGHTHGARRVVAWHRP